MPPIRLSDSELAAVMAAARPIAPADRAAFLELVAERLRGQSELRGLHLTDSPLEQQPPIDQAKAMFRAAWEKAKAARA